MSPGIDCPGFNLSMITNRILYNFYFATGFVFLILRHPLWVEGNQNSTLEKIKKNKSINSKYLPLNVTGILKSTEEQDENQSFSIWHISFFFNYDTENTNYENLTQNLSFNNEHMTYLSRENNTLDISELFWRLNVTTGHPKLCLDQKRINFTLSQIFRGHASSPVIERTKAPLGKFLWDNPKEEGL